MRDEQIATSMFYILDAERRAIPTDEVTWALWLDRHGDDRRVAYDQIGDSEISTVFVGLDMSIPPIDRPPLLFETMIFGGEHDGYCMRCSTWQQAEQQHNRAKMKLTS